jgi:pentatricopeptide repeat protein
MILDGIQPISDTFAPLFVGCMKGSRLQDAFYFYEEMKSMGYIPDVSM